MIIEIGIVAGEIWHYLDERKEVAFSEVVANIKHPKELALMSLGWLAREGHVIVKEEAGEYRVCLREE